MQVYHNAGVILATHDDGQTIPDGAYGTAKRLIVPDGIALVASEYGMPTLPADLDSLRAIAQATVSAWKRTAQAGGFEHGGANYDSDDRSLLMLGGASQAAQIALAQSAPFEIAWTTRDNAVVTLTAPQMIGLGLASIAHVNAVHQTALAHKAAIAAAEDDAAIIAVLTAIGTW